MSSYRRILNIFFISSILIEPWLCFNYSGHFFVVYFPLFGYSWKSVRVHFIDRKRCKNNVVSMCILTVVETVQTSVSIRVNHCQSLETYKKEEEGKIRRRRRKNKKKKKKLEKKKLHDLLLDVRKDGEGGDLRWRKWRTAVGAKTQVRGHQTPGKERKKTEIYLVVYTDNFRNYTLQQAGRVIHSYQLVIDINPRCQSLPDLSPFFLSHSI